MGKSFISKYSLPVWEMLFYSFIERNMVKVIDSQLHMMDLKRRLFLFSRITLTNETDIKQNQLKKVMLITTFVTVMAI